MMRTSAVMGRFHRVVGCMHCRSWGLARMDALLSENRTKLWEGSGTYRYQMPFMESLQVLRCCRSATQHVGLPAHLYQAFRLIMINGCPRLKHVASLPWQQLAAQPENTTAAGLQENGTDSTSNFQSASSNHIR